MIHRKLFVGILLLSLLNIIIFFQRDAFQYQPYANYSSLYSSKKDNLKKWEKFTHDFSSAEFKEAKHLTDSICKGAKTTLAKTLLLSATLFSHFREQIGAPSVAFSSLSPLNQYKQLFLCQTDKLWCGNFAQIFSFFCWSQGVICRTIEIMQPGNHHVLTECYLPETKQWVMVDPTFNLLLVENDKGVPLDLVSFKEALRKKAPLFAVETTGNAICKTTLDYKAPAVLGYYSKDDPLYYYHRTDTRKVYTTSSKVQRYLLSQSWYDIFDDKNRSNFMFYVKTFFILLFVFSILVFLAVYAKQKI